MKSLLNGFRDGYSTASEKSGPARPFFEWPRRTGSDRPSPPTEANDDPSPARVAELEATLKELADYAEQMRARIAELESLPAGDEMFACVLRLPGVERWLRMTFHPDKHPDASADEKQALTEATQKVNAAYAALKGKA